MDGKEHILEILKTSNGKQIDICAMVYSVIMQDAHSAELFQFFCENAEGITSSRESEAPKVFTDGELLDYQKSYGKIVDGILEKLLIEKPQKEEFYLALWKKITLKELFIGEKEQIFALYFVWLDSRIPYFELPETIHIEHEEYREISQKLLTEKQEARFILSSDFKQWTEVSYLLLELLDKISEQKDRAVLLSYIFQTREKMLMSKLISSSRAREQNADEQA